MENEIGSKVWYRSWDTQLTLHLLRILTCIEFHRCHKVISLCATGLCLGHCELDLVIIELEYRVR